MAGSALENHKPISSSSDLLSLIADRCRKAKFADLDFENTAHLKSFKYFFSLVMTSFHLTKSLHDLLKNILNPSKTGCKNAPEKM